MSLKLNESTVPVHDTQEFLIASAELTRQFLNGVGLRGLTKVVSQLLCNPVAVVDTAFKLIAYHTDIDVDDPVWTNLVLSGYSNEEYLSAAEEEEITRRCYEHDGPIIVDTIIGKVSRKMLCRIVIRGNIIASLGVLQVSRLFTKTDETILDFACKLIAVELEKSGHYLSTDSHGQEQLIYDLLMMRSGSQAVLEQRLRIFKVAPKHAYYVFCIPIPVDRYFTTDYIRRELNLLFPDFHTITLEEKKYLAMVIDCKPALMLYTRKILSDFLKRNGLRAGVSDNFTSLIDLQYYYKCARSAYETGVVMQPVETIYAFEVFRIYIYFANAHSSLDTTTYCHKALKIIRSFDDDNGTDLFRTLNVFLTHMGNLKKASETLCIHRNTMRNRIEKIIDLTNLDLEDGNVYFDLVFSFRLLEYESHKI